MRKKIIVIFSIVIFNLLSIQTFAQKIAIIKWKDLEIYNHIEKGIISKLNTDYEKFNIDGELKKIDPVLKKKYLAFFIIGEQLLVYFKNNKDLPIYFSGVFSTEKILENAENFSGVSLEPDISQTLYLTKNIKPDISEITIFYKDYKFNSEWEKIANDEGIQIKKYHCNDLKDFSYKILEVPAEIILLVPDRFFTDKNVMFILTEVCFKKRKIPFVGISEIHFSQGAIACIIPDFEQHGSQVAELYNKKLKNKIQYNEKNKILLNEKVFSYFGLKIPEKLKQKKQNFQ